jgi:hypothetical protein
MMLNAPGHSPSRNSILPVERASALDNPEPFAPRQAHEAGQHANSRAKQGVRLLQQCGLTDAELVGMSVPEQKAFYRKFNLTKPRQCPSIYRLGKP